MRNATRRTRFIPFTLLGLAFIRFPASAGATSIDYLDKQWSFSMGAGYTPIMGGMNSQLTGGWNFSMGLGYNLSEKLGLLLEYGSHHGGVESGILNRYSALLGGSHTDGTTHIWSITLNPTWKFTINDLIGGYFIGGGGYYHTNAQITTPTLAFAPGYCDPFWGCWPGGLVQADAIVAERKDDTGGVNVGMGFTFNISREVQFYVESRYHYILLHGPDLQLLPVTAGFRF